MDLPIDAKTSVVSISVAVIICIPLDTVCIFMDKINLYYYHPFFFHSIAIF